MYKFLIFLLVIIAVDVNANDNYEIDASILKPGQYLRILREDGPIWVFRRDKDMIESIPKSTPDVRRPNSESRQPDNINTIERSLNPEFFVFIARCIDETDLEVTLPLVPSALKTNNIFKENIGYYCRATGAAYDHAGRVYRNYFSHNVDHFRIPQYELKNKSTIIISKQPDKNL